MTGSSDRLCEECAVVDLTPLARGHDVLDTARTVFEAHAVRGPHRQWLLGDCSFVRLVVGIADPVEARRVFEDARANTLDFGTGWDPPPPGCAGFFGFVEALLVLAAARGNQDVVSGSNAPRTGLAVELSGMLAHIQSQSGELSVDCTPTHDYAPS